jgi:hypothetical protein
VDQERGGSPSHFQQKHQIEQDRTVLDLNKVTEALLIEREVEEEGQGTRVERVGAAPVSGYIKVSAGLNVRSERVSHAGAVQASRDLQSDSLITGSPYFASLPTLITFPPLFPISRRSRTPL